MYNKVTQCNTEHAEAIHINKLAHFYNSTTKQTKINTPIEERARDLFALDIDVTLTRRSMRRHYRVKVKGYVTVYGH